MRLLFVSGTTLGGSGRSTRELAAQLAQRGHQVLFLVDGDDHAPLARWLYGHLADVAVRLGATPASSGARWLESLPGRRTNRVLLDGHEHWTTPVPQNALDGALDAFQPDVVVAGTMERWRWRRVHEVCRRRGMTTVLYIRGSQVLDHLDTGAIPDAAVANAQSLADALQARGHDCYFVPSVIDVEVTRTTSTRQVALAINPVAEKGVDVVWQVAKRLPDVPFVVQEAWPLVGDELAGVLAHVAELPNVEFRRRMQPGPELYADARVLLVPYRDENRPRVVLEAQANGIPIVSADVPSINESVGPGGLRAGLDDLDEWARQIRRLYDDEALYAGLAQAATAHSRRPSVDRDVVAASFESVLGRAVRANAPATAGCATEAERTASGGAVQPSSGPAELRRTT